MQMSDAGIVSMPKTYYKKKAPEGYLRICDAAEYLERSVSRVHQLINDGALEWIQPDGPMTLVFVSEKSLKEFKEAHDV